MTPQIKATNLELSPAIREYLASRLQAIAKLLPAADATKLSVELAKETKHHKQGQVYKAEVSATVGGERYYASAFEEDIYAAIDVVKDEFIRELKSGKGRRLALFRRGGRAIKNLLRGLNPWRRK